MDTSEIKKEKPENNSEDDRLSDLQNKIESVLTHLNQSGLKFIELAIRVSIIEKLLVSKGILSQEEIDGNISELAQKLIQEVGSNTG